MKLEGRVVGPWVKEFESAWNLLKQVLGSRKLAIDLCEVTYMDLSARGLLAEIHRKTGAELHARTPLMKYFVDQASQRKNNTEGEEQ